MSRIIFFFSFSQRRRGGGFKTKTTSTGIRVDDGSRGSRSLGLGFRRIRKSQVLYADCFRRGAGFRTPTAHILAVGKELSSLADEHECGRRVEGTREARRMKCILYFAFYFILHFFFLSFSSVVMAKDSEMCAKEMAGKFRRFVNV